MKTDVKLWCPHKEQKSYFYHSYQWRSQGGFGGRTPLPFSNPSGLRTTTYGVRHFIIMKRIESQLRNGRDSDSIRDVRIFLQSTSSLWNSKPNFSADCFRHLLRRAKRRSRFASRLSNSLCDDVASHHLPRKCARVKHQVKQTNVWLVYRIETKFYKLVSVERKLKFNFVTPIRGTIRK